MANVLLVDFTPNHAGFISSLANEIALQGFKVYIAGGVEGHIANVNNVRVKLLENDVSPYPDVGRGTTSNRLIKAVFDICFWFAYLWNIRVTAHKHHCEKIFCTPVLYFVLYPFLLGKKVYLLWHAPFAEKGRLRGIATLLLMKMCNNLFLAECVQRKVMSIIPKWLNISSFVLLHPLPSFPQRMGVLTNGSAKRVFTYLGSSAKRKGFSELRKANRYLKMKHSEYFLVYGGNLLLGKETSLQENEVLFDRILDDYDYQSLIENSSYVVLPYDREFYSLSVSGVFFEAMALHRPVIASNAPFFADLFATYGEIGIIYNSRDALGLEKAMLKGLSISASSFDHSINMFLEEYRKLFERHLLEVLHQRRI